jgi:hypothetical protein
MAKLPTDASKTSQTASSGLQAEASASSSEVVTAVEARVNTKANAVDHFLISPSKTVKPPPHKRDHDFFSMSFPSH